MGCRQLWGYTMRGILAPNIVQHGITYLPQCTVEQMVAVSSLFPAYKRVSFHLTAFTRFLLNPNLGSEGLITSFTFPRLQSQDHSPVAQYKIMKGNENTAISKATESSVLGFASQMENDQIWKLSVTKHFGQICHIRGEVHTSTNIT